MASNFAFLEQNEKFNTFAEACLEAEKSIAVSPATTAILTRRALELAVKWLYTSDSYLKVPYQDNLSSLIHDPTFKDIIDPELFPLIRYIIKLGNISAHTSNKVPRKEAVVALHNLHQFVAWIEYCYSEDDSTAPEFNEELLPTGEERKVSPEELENLQNQLGARDKRLKDMVSENEQLRQELRRVREQRTQDYHFQVDEISEFETRKRYIDVDLKDAGWVLGEDCLEEYPVEGMPFGSGQGFVDYVLLGANGKPLALVEAKRASSDPSRGKQQAVLYANCLEERFGQRPIIFYTNGFETYLWDDLSYSERRVAGFYTQEELQLAIDRRTRRLPLENIKIKDGITNRYYQKEAIKAVCEALGRGERRALLVMATGSGKTRTVISLVDVLTRHDWVKNVLFLADRTALVRQAKNNFKDLLPNLSLANLLDSRDNPQSRMIFSTYPTMMNAIDETKLKDGQRLFTVGHFDLIIIDEAHRSIFKKYQAIFNYFDSLLVGLTATPKDEVDKNTYTIFNLENNVPTYAYELEEAVNDKYLVPYISVETTLKFIDEGIHYEELSAEEKEAFEETFGEEDRPDFIAGEKLNTWLFNQDTIDKVLIQLMEKGLKVEGGDKLGKTIIFAKNHRHAVEITKRFNALYPQYRGKFAQVIDNQVNYAQSLIDDFSTGDKMPQIAVSVDMLDTGIDVPQVVNLVFFKKVRSKAKFWQMVGRGTRLCPDLFGPGLDKEHFYIFDYCGNFEFFRVQGEGQEVKTASSLSERIFVTKVGLVKELQHLDYQEERFINYRNKLVEELVREAQSLNRENFLVKQHLREVDNYSSPSNWQRLGEIDVQKLEEHIAPLIVPPVGEELAKRFDALILGIELALLLGTGFSRAKNRVQETAHSLAQIGTIPQVLAQRATIQRVLEEDFWASADILALDLVREALRDLVKFIEVKDTIHYYTNFADEILAVSESPGFYGTNNLQSYRKKVNQYLRDNQNHLAIHKLRTNKPLERQDFLALEKILWNELGTKADYQKEFGDTPLTILVRQIVGLDQEAANSAFSEFLRDQELDSRQIRFVKSLVDYIVKNGHMLNKAVLQGDPFQAIGSITEVFELEKAVKIVGIIDTINKNAVDIIGA